MELIPILVLLGIWYPTLKRWQRGIYFLLVFMPFAGVASLFFHPWPLAKLFKDFLFVMPAYFGFFFLTRHSRNDIPNSVKWPMLALVILVLFYSLTLKSTNFLMAAIGAKVWLFYLPLTFLGFGYLKHREDLIFVLRLIVGVAWVPCIIGILQWLAAMAYGYQASMQAIYGPLAPMVTQGYAQFYVGGILYRIPSTFTFVAQYFGFTLSVIAPAYSLSQLETDNYYKSFANISLFLFVLSAFLSGARGGFVFVPMLLVIIALITRQVSQILKTSFFLPLIFFLALNIGGLGFHELGNLVTELLFKYSDEIATQGLITAIRERPLGSGTGMNTGPARHALESELGFSGVENYYAKAVVELGIVGLLAVVWLFLSVVFSGFRVYRDLTDPGLKSTAAAFLAFILTIVLNSFKGWQIDLDPVNVYFWLFAGFLLKLKYIEPIYVDYVYYEDYDEDELE